MATSVFNNLPGGEKLSEQVINMLDAEFNRKLDEQKRIIEESLRAEFARQYKNDNHELVETIDRMVREGIAGYATEVLQERNALREERSKLSETIRVNRSEYKKALNEHITVVEKFVTETLHKELREFVEDQHAVKVQRVRLSKEIMENKANFKKALTEHINKIHEVTHEQMARSVAQLHEAKKTLETEKNKIRESNNERMKAAESFIVNRVHKEMREFAIDQKALKEARQTLINNSNRILSEARAEFVSQSAKLVETFVTRKVSSELSEIKEDMKTALENDTGRKFYEALAPLFIKTHLHENATVRKLEKVVDLQKKQINESRTIVENAQRKVNLMEQRNKRNGIMQELLGTIEKSKRPLMEEYLATTKTEKLRESFHRYLPAVIGGKTNTQPSNNRRALVENQQITEVTGQRRGNNFSDETAEIQSLQRLAGIKN